MRKTLNKKRIYTTSILLSLVIVLSFFSFQVIFFIDNFKLQYLFVPSLLSIGLGILVGKIQILSKTLQSQERIFHTIADEAKEFSYFRTNNGDYEYISPVVEKITGYSQEDFYKDRNLFNNLISEKDKALWYGHLHDIETQEDEYRSLELRITHKDGHEIWINHSCSGIYENGRKIGIRSVNTNISKRKRDEQAIYELSIYDNLTTLPNRHKIFETLHSFIDTQTQFSVLLLNLNRFKKINDNLGHNVGDQILQLVANNLKKCSKKNTFVGRLGGDEFLVVLKNRITKEEITPYLDRLYALIEKDYQINNFTFFMGVSIGVASYPQDSTHVEDLLACADKAMFKSKSILSTHTIFYNEMVQDYSMDDFIIEKDLRDAIKNNDLLLYLQPKYDMQTKKIDSYEALIRWEKDGQYIPPEKFIPIAEETGLINDITSFVLDETFQLAKKWYDKKREPYKISINVSVVDFVSDYFLSNIQKKLEHYAVKAEWFELEMTESIFLDKDKKIEQRIQSLIQMGFSIALDDFGTGYSSLAYLTRFPINTLKIDKSFVENLTTDYTKSFALLKSILSIADALKLNIVIEGVETQEQLDIIQSLGLYVIQGFIFYKPMSIDAIERLAS
ncbi:EAL domain-containing protein [Sulfurimonas sp.]|uniref:putative bifunctional diguanylate cyclase/phosphodiesterase n=1 Tax=Sulfurimonas sp. TaxID=2022749 RepID=UPI003D0EF180